MSDAYTFVSQIDAGTVYAQFILHTFSRYCDEHGACALSSKRIGAETRISARAVASSLNLLEERGIIERIRQTGEHGKRAPDLIRLVGYVDWRASLKTLKYPTKSPSANPAPSDQVQIPHVLDQHVLAQHVLALPPAFPPSSFSPTPPHITTPLSPPNPLSGETSFPPTSKPKKTKGRGAYTPAFEDFWCDWPKPRREKSDKRKSFHRWTGDLEHWSAETIMAAAKRYVSDPEVRKENFKYCCLVEVFLNGKLEAAVEAVTNAIPSKTERVWSTAVNGFVERSV